MTPLEADFSARPETRQRGGDRARLRGAVGLALASLLLALPAHASESLELMPDWVVTSVLFVAFLVLIVPLDRLIFQPLLRVMDEREERITGARRRAAHVQGQAQESLQRYEDAMREAYQAAALERRQKLEVARSELQAVTQRARDEAEREVLRARVELEESLLRSRDELRGSANELANLAAERILGRSLA